MPDPGGSDYVRREAGAFPTTSARSDYFKNREQRARNKQSKIPGKVL